MRDRRHEERSISSGGPQSRSAAPGDVAATTIVGAGDGCVTIDSASRQIDQQARLLAQRCPGSVGENHGQRAGSRGGGRPCPRTMTRTMAAAAARRDSHASTRPARALTSSTGSAPGSRRASTYHLRTARRFDVELFVLLALSRRQPCFSRRCPTRALLGADRDAEHPAVSSHFARIRRAAACRAARGSAAIDVSASLQIERRPILLRHGRDGMRSTRSCGSSLRVPLASSWPSRQLFLMQRIAPGVDSSHV